jgi:hypothetical protein
MKPVSVMSLVKGIKLCTKKTTAKKSKFKKISRIKVNLVMILRLLVIKRWRFTPRKARFRGVFPPASKRPGLQDRLQMLL